MTNDDMSLVRAYAARQSEPAFEALVSRYVNLVFSAALRQTGDWHLAEEITQAVFVILARKAGALGPGTILPSWLHRTAVFVAADALKARQCRTEHEQEAAMETILNGGCEASSPSIHEETWARIAPLLDAALARLAHKDRAAIVLRFFENRELKQVGATLGVSEEAAKKRVSRALEKLRRFFLQRGVDSTAAAIGETMSANSIQAAPAALAKSVTAIALAKSAAASTSTLTLIQGALKIMAWTKARTAIVVSAAVILTAGLGTGIYAYHFVPTGPAAQLQSALRIPKPATGTWAYPSEKVTLAILHFGTNRAAAFPILEKATEGSNAEARKQAVAAMGMVGMPPRPELAKYGLLGEPSSDVAPFLWKILNSTNDDDLSHFALTSLMGIGFRPKDIPVLAALLVRSHGRQLSPTALSPMVFAHLSVAQRQILSSGANNDQMLQRYIPEAIADTIQKNPQAAAPFIPSVEDLLNDTNPDVRFGAACALAKYLGVNDLRVSKELKAGLKITQDTVAPGRIPRSNPEDGLKHLMAIETLRNIGPVAKPMIPALLDYAHSTQDKFMRQLAFSVAGQIESNLRKTMPEVNQAMKNDPTLKSAASTK